MATGSKLSQWKIQVRKGFIEYLILHCLSESDDHGYNIVMRIKSLSSFDVTESAVYPILSRYKKEGIISGYLVPSPKGPARSFCKLTPLGKTRLIMMRGYIKDLQLNIQQTF